MKDDKTTDSTVRSALTAGERLAMEIETTPQERFRKAIIAWNHICANPYVCGEDKDCVMRLLVAEGERNRWLVWDETVMQYVFVPDQTPISEVK